MQSSIDTKFDTLKNAMDAKNNDQVKMTRHLEEKVHSSIDTKFDTFGNVFDTKNNDHFNIMKQLENKVDTIIDSIEEQVRNSTDQIMN